MTKIVVHNHVCRAADAARQRKFSIGERVQGGKGEDYDTGRVVAYIDPPQGQADLLVSWDSGSRTPAISAELRRIARS